MSLTDFDGAFTGCSATGQNISFLVFNSPIQVDTRPKIWVCGRVLTVIVGSKLEGMNIHLLLRFCVCCKAEVSSTGRLLVQGNPTLCGVSECDLDTSTIRRPTPTRAVERRRKLCNPLPSLKKHFQ
jgi:hypothetical protein